MSTQKYTLRKSRKYKNLVSVGLGLATAVAIGLATDNEAFASNDVVNNSTVESIKQNIEKTESKVVTKEEVSTAKLNLDTVKGQVKEQSNVVDGISSELSKVSKEKAELEKLSKESTPENVEKVNKEIQNKDTEIKSENEKLLVLKGQELSKQQEKQSAQQKLESAKKELESAKSKTKEAEANLQNAKDVLNGTNADKVIKALEEANKQLLLAKENVVNKEKALAEAKKLDKERQDKIDNLTSEKDKLENQVSEQKQDLLVKTKEADATQKALEEAKKELVKAQNDVDSINNIVLSDEYVQALKTYMDYSLPESTREKAKEVLKSENEKLLKLNTYKQNKNDDDTLLDVNNLSDEVRKELSLFASDLVNQIRKQFGTKNTVVTSSAIDFAKKVADEYVNSNFGIQNGHNEAGISKVASEYGLSQGQFYENLYGLYSENNQVTKGSLKSMIYNGIVKFMLNGTEWLHAQSIAGINYNNPQKDYLGVDFSVSKGTGVHFITVSEEEVNNATKNNFDTKEIPQTRTPEQLRVVLDTAKSDYALKDSNNSQKQQEKETAQSVLSGTQNVLKNVVNNLDKVLAIRELTQSAQLNLQEAQQKLERDTKIQEQAQSNYDNLSADIKVKQQAVKLAEKELQEVKGQELSKQVVYDNFNSDVNKIDLDLKSKQQEIKDQQKVISNLENKLEETKVYLNKLQNAPVLLEEATKQQKVLEEKLLVEKTKLEQLKVQEKELQAKYSLLLSEYNRQQTSLELEKLSKELKTKGNLENDNVLSVGTLAKTGITTSSSILGVLLLILTFGLYRRNRI
ncbi:SEC10/PgrA surface exclusion domain-containing protein [Gemella sp. 27098_8_92]|uniref:SEC10/PgrA surface exclusion domain-containing protein n=1 Tax=Gemella sp. 27098_8_92 TaxID=3003687 RepID=UPI00352BD9CF